MSFYLNFSSLKLILKLLMFLSCKEYCFCFLCIKLDCLFSALLNSYMLVLAPGMLVALSWLILADLYYWPMIIL
jgi:hypothetical protein